MTSPVPPTNAACVGRLETSSRTGRPFRAGIRITRRRLLPLCGRNKGKSGLCPEPAGALAPDPDSGGGSERLEHAAIDEIGGAQAVARFFRTQKNKEVRDFGR